jgi:hypothetical protein
MKHLIIDSSTSLHFAQTRGLVPNGRSNDKTVIILDHLYFIKISMPRNDGFTDNCDCD